MGVTIRPATEADWPSVLAINVVGVPGVSRLDRAELARLAALAAHFSVAEERGVVLGYLLAVAPGADYDGEEFLWFRAHAPRALYVDQIAVAASARRRGIASALYAEAVRAATAAGYAGLACEVNLRPPNPASLRLHRALGFEPCGSLDARDGRSVSLLLLEFGRAHA